MNVNSMREFLSPESIKLHTDYVKTLNAQHSICERSMPEIRGKTPIDISTLNIKRSIKNEILPRIISIKSHETYFSSYTSISTPCPALKKYFSSESAFLFDVLTAAREMTSEFLFVFAERGRPMIRSSDEARGVYLTHTPILAVDLSEHAYFLDYNFDRDEYLKRAVAHLDLKKLSQYLK